MDKGREWYLMLYGQEILADKRYNTTRSPHVQSTSTQVGIYCIDDSDYLILIC